MRLRYMVTVLAATLVLPLAAQAQTGGAAGGTPVTIAGVSAITVNRPGTVTTAVKLREKPSTSAAIVEYWATTTQKEPELFLPAGTAVLALARKVDREKVGDWTNCWHRVEFTTAKQGKVQAWAYGEFIRIESGARTAAFLADGTPWAWGNNKYGQLRDSRLSPSSTPVRLVEDSDWVFLAAGGFCSLAIKRDGSL